VAAGVLAFDFPLLLYALLAVIMAVLLLVAALVVV
jgi:hypothetical protein